MNEILDFFSVSRELRILNFLFTPFSLSENYYMIALIISLISLVFLYIIVKKVNDFKTLLLFRTTLYTFVFILMTSAYIKEHRWHLISEVSSLSISEIKSVKYMYNNKKYLSQKINGMNMINYIHCIDKNLQIDYCNIKYETYKGINNTLIQQIDYIIYNSIISGKLIKDSDNDEETMKI